MKRKKNKKSSKPNILPKRPRKEPIPEESDDMMLSEFSDDTNDFFVDESGDHDEPSQPDPRDSRDHRDRRGSHQPHKPHDPKAAKSSKKPVTVSKKPISPLRRKIRRILSFVAIITIVIVIGVILSLTVLFKTQNYEVIGNTLYNQADIINVCDIDEGTNIFLAPKTPAEKRIKSSFPYFEDVKVGFKIPDTIKIEVTEAIEGYLIKITDKEYLVISTKGRILDRVTDKSRFDLPIFIGPKLVSGDIGDYVEYEDETIVNIIENITQVFADNGYQGITEVDATNPANITFTYDGRIKVKLGIPEDISYKIRTAMTIIETKIDVNPGTKISGTLDVSRCNDTKRSYFNENSSINLNATENPSEAASKPSADGSGGSNSGSANTGEDTFTDDGDSEWIDDNAEWQDAGGGEWVDDGAYYDGEAW